MNQRLQLQLGDLTAMDVDVLVNSTDPSMRDGGPVHKAVHAAAGEGLAAECVQVGGCPVGEARLTRGHDLKAPFVIHTVAPTWRDGLKGEPAQLASCYRSALALAELRGFRTLAFPSLGSGRQPQIPLEVAAPIAVRAILAFLEDHAFPEKVYLVCFDAPTYQAYQRALREALP
ncbi:MAG: O-acetyl-ADP-ribose deacetylase [Acidobacteria bacterium ADurb.Bin340]|nr:MAG: O-acetyl-ADP-ribose deacetylase [Acidobacteria bacterium ADurb.Bin340]HQL47965.1 macro domain-containing protein [Holophaga sp.]